jgi:hypothetical protein
MVHEEKGEVVYRRVGRMGLKGGIIAEYRHPVGKDADAATIVAALYPESAKSSEEK